MVTKQEAHRRIAEFEDGLGRQVRRRRARSLAAPAFPILLVGGRLAHHRRPPEMERPPRISPQLSARIRQRERDRELVEQFLADYVFGPLVPLRPSRRGAKRKVTLTALYDYTHDHPDKGFRKIAANLHLSTATVKPLLKVLTRLGLYEPKHSPRRP